MHNTIVPITHLATSFLHRSHKGRLHTVAMYMGLVLSKKKPQSGVYYLVSYASLYLRAKFDGCSYQLLAKISGYLEKIFHYIAERYLLLFTFNTTFEHVITHQAIEY